MSWGDTILLLLLLVIIMIAKIFEPLDKGNNNNKHLVFTYFILETVLSALLALSYKKS